MIKNLVSIILPVYNGESFLAEAIESCINQSYKNFELIIVNDCSTDESLNIANSYAALDTRIIIIDNKENKKLPASLNIGHNIAKGKYLTWTSDDNILKSNFLETHVQNLKSSTVDVVYSNFDIILTDGSLKRIHTTGPTEHLMFGNKIGASFMYKRKVFETLKGFDTSLFLLEDYDFWLRASLKFKFFYLRENLYKYRLHDNSLTSKVAEDVSQRNKHKLAAIEMFDKMAVEMSWNKMTMSFCVENLLGKNISVFEYFKNKGILISDLNKFVGNGELSELKSGLRLIVRAQLINNNRNHNIKTLVEVIKKDMSLLFHKSFSKKATLNYIKNCLL